MSEPPRKKLRCKAIQKNKLIEHMALHKELGLGTSTCAMGVQRHNEEWRMLAEDLSELGPAKTVAQWKTTWRDLRSNAKSSNAEATRAQKQTGNSVEIPVLSNNDELILSVIGKTSSQGIPDVPESGVGVSVCVTNAAEQVEQVDPPALVESQAPRIAQPPKKPRKVDLGEAYMNCQAETLVVLTDISNNMKERNLIEKERNEILQEKNRLLEMLLLGHRQNGVEEEVVVIDGE